MARIYQTPREGEAKYKVWIAPLAGEADLWVYATENLFLASGDAYWFITTNRGLASSLLYFGDRGIADFSIFFVHERSRAGWQRRLPHIQGTL